MVLYFITGNRGKFEEVKSVISDVKQIDFDLPEIQELDARKIIEAKLMEARGKYDGELICEDTSIYLDCLNGLPGPLIKWFMKSLGNKGIYELVKKYGDFGATAKTIIGYSNGKHIEFFEGSVKGKIASPMGEGFGWDPIFQPDGSNKTFGEMDMHEKNEISMRRAALEKLKEYLDQ